MGNCIILQGDGRKMNDRNFLRALKIETLESALEGLSVGLGGSTIGKISNVRRCRIRCLRRWN
jgi:hypothetical protein